MFPSRTRVGSKLWFSPLCPGSMLDLGFWPLDAPAFTLWAGLPKKGSVTEQLILSFEGASQVALVVKNPPGSVGAVDLIHGQEDPLE